MLTQIGAKYTVPLRVVGLLCKADTCFYSVFLLFLYLATLLKGVT